MLYEYECKTCGHLFEVFQSINDDKFKEYFCEKCKSIQPVIRVIGAPSFFLSGDGWSKDGYSKPKPKNTA